MSTIALVEMINCAALLHENAIALKNTQRIITTPNRPPRTPKIVSTLEPPSHSELKAYTVGWRKLPERRGGHRQQ